MYPHPVYVVNLPERTDRLSHTQNQFNNRIEFSVKIVQAIVTGKGAEGLWRTLCLICKNAITLQLKYIIFCEDDHKFTKDYSKEFFESIIHDCDLLRPEVVLGGVSWMDSCIVVNERLAWVGKFTGLQFAIIYKDAFIKIIEADFYKWGAADLALSGLFSRKFLVTRFISIQQDFGYSDVTKANNGKGQVESLFKQSYLRVSLAQQLDKIYQSTRASTPIPNKINNSEIPVFELRNRDIIKEIQNENREINQLPNPFYKWDDDRLNLRITPKNSVNQLKKILRFAIKGDFEVIAISLGGITFQNGLSAEHIQKVVKEAYMNKAELLTLGMSEYSFAHPVTQNITWVANLEGSNFILLFKKAFTLILNEDINEKMSIQESLTGLLTNKFCVSLFWTFPSIEMEVALTAKYAECQKRISNIYQFHSEYKS